MENKLEQPVSPNQIGEVLPNFEIDQKTLCPLRIRMNIRGMSAEN